MKVLLRAGVEESARPGEGGDRHTPNPTFLLFTGVHYAAAQALHYSIPPLPGGSPEKFRCLVRPSGYERVLDRPWVGSRLSSVVQNQR
jgi:hypothetical protein